MVVLLACGPTVGASDGDGSSESTSASGGATQSTSSTSTSTTLTTGADNSTGVVTTDAETTTTSADDSNDSSDVTFIQAPDVPGHCNGYCDAWAQDCPEGMKCSAWDCEEVAAFWITPRCVELDRDAAEVGEACSVQDRVYSGADNCEVSSLCWDIDPDTLAGTCIGFCQGTAANPVCELESQSCFNGLNELLNLCLPRCSPLAADCGVARQCVFNEDGLAARDFVCIPDVHLPAQAYADDCEDSLGCGTGLVCVASGEVPGCTSDRCCTTLGSLSAPPVCPDAMQTCAALYADGDAPPGYEQLCACTIP